MGKDMQEKGPGQVAIDLEQFKVNLDCSNPEGYSRDSDVNPTDLLHEWTQASVQKWQSGAKELKRQYLALVGSDANHYGLSPEELMELHVEALDEEFANYDFGADY